MWVYILPSYIIQGNPWKSLQPKSNRKLKEIFFSSTYKHIIFIKQTFFTVNRKSAIGLLKNLKMLNHDKMI